MKKRTAIAIGIGAALLLLPGHGSDAAGARLIELDLRSGALPAAVSANNVVVVGGLADGSGFYWTPITDVVFNGGVSSQGVSGDGRTIVGIATDHGGVRQAGIWLQRAEWRLLGSFSPTAAPCDKALSSAYGVSRDGQIVVGVAQDGCKFSHAFRWNPSSGMADLGSSVADHGSLAAGVSGNGNVVVGYQEDTTGYRRGARWLNGREELIPGVDDFVGQARAANIDGSIIVGQNCRPALGSVDQNAWMWTALGGTTCLPAPQKITVPGPGVGPVVTVKASATSDDGQVVGGEQNIGGSADSNAIVWIRGRPAYLKDLLRVNGIPDAFATWVNTGGITGMTPDGRILVGSGAAALGFRGYIVVLPSNPVVP